MTNLIKGMKLSVKIAVLGIGGVVVTAGALLTLAVWESGRYHTLAQREVDALINADLDHITKGIYNLVRTEDEAEQVRLAHNLNAARHVLAAAGRVSLSEETVTWTAVNQFTTDSQRIQLPKMTIGSQWLGQVKDPAAESLVVDEVTRLIGETATIFQRMNAQGDMLRVATTVRDAAGTRAIGTFVPAVDPDGNPNPVIAAVLKGETYRGRAFVVNAWYLTAYDPIKDVAGEVVGMLYVGTKQKDAEARVRQAILDTKVGKTGYVYVLGGKGEERGHYIISCKGERDGEDIWESKDSDGRYVIQAIIEKATTLRPGELATERYRWQNPGESAPRWKIARLAYYEPWDWVIGTSVYEDELQAYWEILSRGRMRMAVNMGVAAAVSIALIGPFSVLGAWRLARPVRRMTRAVERIAGGDLAHTVDVSSSDEIGTLGRAFNCMVEKLDATMQGLRKSEEFLDNIIENIPDMLFVKEAAELRYVRFNKAGEKMLGYSRETLIGKSDYDFFPTQEADFFTSKDREVLRTKQVLDIPEETIRTRTQGERVLHTKKIPIVDKEGNAQYVLGISEDITARRCAEEALRKSEARYRRLIETMNEGLAMTDPELRITFVNERLCTMFKYSREEVLGRQVYEFVREDYREVIDAQLAQRREGKERTYEVAWKTKAGDTVYTLVSPKGLLDEQGAYLGSIVVLTDITERKQAEDALRRSELEKAILNEIDGIFLTRPGEEMYAEILAVVVRVMESAYGLFGFIAENGDLVMPSLTRGIWTKCEVREKNFVFPPHTWGKSLWGRAVREKKSFSSHGPFQTPEGHLSIENFLAVPIVFGEKTIGLMCCANKHEGFGDEDRSLLERVATHISPILSARLQQEREERERKRLQSQLLQVQKLEAIGTLAGGVAHDFNNILMAIQGRVSLLLLQGGDESAFGEDLRAIEGLVSRGADLTRQLLGFARGGKHEVRVTDLNELVIENSEIFGRTKKEVTIHRRLAEGLWTVEVDRGQIEQVFLNLYVNAWQAMPGGGELYLETENVVLDESYVKPFKVTPGKYVKVTVTDTGVGMDEQTRQRIFEPFFTTRELGQGTGLGLATAYGIVKNHQGIINVYSEPGHGTTFTMYLPAAGSGVGAAEETKEEIVRGEGMILLVDDEEMIREVGGRILEALGYRVLVAASGAEALEIYRERSGEIDLVILDMIMPGMLGGEAFDRLRRINPTVKVLLSSGYSMNGEARGILERGGAGFLQKPLDARALSRKVREILDRP